MSRIAVVYKSQYGYTETYARWIAETLNADLLKTDRIKAGSLQQYDVIIWGGGLYAGGVGGLSLLTKNFDRLKDKALYLFTVGASDTTDPENIKHIRSALDSALTPEMRGKIKIYHFRGGMKYSEMRFLHKAMMGMMMKMLRKKPQSELRAEDKQMMNTYGQDVDFTDQKAIDPMIADVKAIIALQ